MSSHALNIIADIATRILWISVIFVPLGVWKAFELILLAINYVMKS